MRGTLRIYLGAAPGVGKTYAMLDEAQRRAERGTDVVVGIVETHGRQHTQKQLCDLEVLPRLMVDYRGTQLSELDVEAVIARKPKVVCIDELAHTNAPGSRREKRWQDVEDLLDAGIDVISTVNIQHLESLNDVVERITGIRQLETVPDEVVRAAQQVEIVDITPEALRRRMAHGNIYPPERIDAALSNYFRMGNLTALRELSLLWLADKVDEALKRYRADNEIETTWETRERIVVALTGGPEGETLIRRAARIASRTSAGAGADLLAVHVSRSDGLTGADPGALATQRQLVETLGGSYHQVIGDAVAPTLIAFARGQNATQLVLGASSRGRLSMLTRPSIGAATVRLSGDIDVHIVTHEHSRAPIIKSSSTWALSAKRRIAGAAVGVISLPLLTILLSQHRHNLNLSSDLMSFLLAVVAVSAVGGAVPGTIAAVAAFLLLNWYFTPPIHRFTIAEHDNLLALLGFVVVSAVVSITVDIAARRQRQGARLAAESQTLATLAGSVLRGQEALPALVERLIEALSLRSAALLESTEDGWVTLAKAGASPATKPSEADAAAKASDSMVLAVTGRSLTPADYRLLRVLATQAAVVVEQQRLSAEAEAAKPIAEADRMRSALLTAVSHDLRSPLASARAAVDSLHNDQIPWSEQERSELLATAAESLQRLEKLVENLLDMSRLQAGAMSVFPSPVGVDDVVAMALDAVGDEAAEVRIDLPATLPDVIADGPLLERVIANVVLNALQHSPADRPPLVSASCHADRVEVRVVDRGEGVPVELHQQIFTPFQRLGDTNNSLGVGLGLALSRGLTEAMGGTLEPEETPGGGLTMVIGLRIAGPVDEDAAAGGE